MKKMKSDTVLRSDAMKILSKHLGLVEAERFIALILREPFDYTKWRQDLFQDVPLDRFLDDAMKFRESLEEKK